MNLFLYLRPEEVYLTNSHVEFIRIQINEIVHPLARVATSLSNFCIFDDAPSCITKLIANEIL